MNISFPSDTKDVIDAIRNAIGRAATLYTRIEIVCPTCGIDPLSGQALNSFCPTCSGFGYTYTLSGTVLSGHVNYGKLDDFGWATGGQYPLGDATFQVEYTSSNLTLVDNAKYFEIDDKKFHALKKILRGVPTLNRIILILEEGE